MEDKYDEWSGMPLDKLPRDEVRQLLADWKPALHQLEIAAFRDECHWDQPIRSEGYGLMLPHLSKLRRLTRALALRTRLAIAEGDTAAAFRDLQIGYAMARHIGDAPMVIHSLVGVSCAAMMTDQVESLIGSASCPNLYWALTHLPVPFIDCRLAMEWERSAVFLQWPELRDPRHATLSPKQWDKLAQDFADVIGPAFSSTTNPQDAPTPSLASEEARIYPQAKRYLLDDGLSEQKIEAMPKKQVLAIYLVEHYNVWKDELFKWQHVPYWQSWRGIQATLDALAQRKSKDDSATLAAGMLPALGKISLAMARCDRRIAALRCIEAIRLYAAKHDGRLPVSLSEIADVPIPIDPITGKAFDYKLEGKAAVLIVGAAPGFKDPKYLRRYELTIAK